LIPDELLSKYQIGTWNSLDFFDRWLFQSNFPKISAHFISDNIFQLEQNRFLSADMYDLDLYPPETNPFNYIWYIPITCRFGNDSTKFNFTQTFFLDQQIMNISFNNLYFEYFYCNTDFYGYYIMDYTNENWESLSEALDNNNTDLIDIDRSNLLNNAFMGTQTIEESYLIVRGVTQYLYRDIYTGLLSWQTLSYHVNRMLDVLEYESLYSVVQVKEKKLLLLFKIYIFFLNRNISNLLLEIIIEPMKLIYGMIMEHFQNSKKQKKNHFFMKFLF
jgi:aminopeptidase N